LLEHGCSWKIVIIIIIKMKPAVEQHIMSQLPALTVFGAAHSIPVTLGSSRSCRCEAGIACWLLQAVAWLIHGCGAAAAQFVAQPLAAIRSSFIAHAHCIWQCRQKGPATAAAAA
jgi:hypothetical protein